MSRWRRDSRFVLLAVAALLCLPAPVGAQAKDGFVQAMIDLSQAAVGATGGEGPALRSSLDAMAGGLAQWDAAVSRVETGFAGAISAAPPADAARMRATLGVTYLERGRVAEALEHLDLAATLDSSFAPIHLLRGLGHARLDRVAMAADAYGTARTLDPGSAAAAYRYFSATRGAAPSAERTAALDALSGAVRGGAGGASDLRVLPLELLDDTSVDVPLFAPSAYAEGFAHLAQARYPEALASLRVAVAADPLVTDPALASAEARAGASALAAGDAKAAVQAFSSVADGSRSSEVQRLLGVSYWRLEDYIRSLEHLRAATRLTPSDERAWLSIADVLVASGERDAARDTLSDLVRRFPRSGLVNWKLGRLHQALGDERSALHAYETAGGMPMLAGASRLWAAIGRLYHNQLELDSAAAAFERRVQAAPNDSDAHFDLGEVFRAQERLTDALAEYLAAALFDPAGARGPAMAGLVHASADRDADGVPLLRLALARDPGHLEARYALSRALLRMGRVEEATQELKIFQQLQTKAMEDERRRFRENQLKIESTLGAPAARELAR